MKPIVILYATREGHTQKIAERVAGDLDAAGFAGHAVNLAEQPDIDLAAYSGAVLAGSVHGGKHESELVRFVKTHRDVLEHIPTALLSVSLSQAGVERSDYTEEARRKAAADVHHMIETFEAETGWHPGREEPVAGALMYSKYNILIRFVMKLIARRQHADVDASRDYEYTNWTSLDRFAREFAAEVAASQ
jgi:menaquinone-dependent protoporphyrinogen oxidase